MTSSSSYLISSHFSLISFPTYVARQDGPSGPQKAYETSVETRQLQIQAGEMLNARAKRKLPEVPLQFSHVLPTEALPKFARLQVEKLSLQASCHQLPREKR